MTDLTDKEYRAYPVESFSSIKHLLEPDGPKTFLYYKNKPFTGNNNTLMGTAVHHYLQGNRHLVAINNFPKIGKAGKEAYAKFEEEFLAMAGDEAIIVPKSFEEKLEAIMSSFNNNLKCAQLLDGCEYETPYFFEIDGVKLKGKPDGVKKNQYIVEIKTSSQATNIEEFREEAKDRHYDMQAYAYIEAHYQTTGERLGHVFVVANTQAPFAVNKYPSGDKFLMEGKKKLHEAISRYKRYILDGEEYEPEEEHL